MAVREQAERLAKPAGIQILSNSAAGEQQPPDTLVPHKAKTLEQAIGLFASGCRPHGIAMGANSSGGAATDTSNSGQGFFTEANNVTGEWQKQNGYFWTGSFWTGELWQLYSETHEEKYRRWGGTLGLKDERPGIHAKSTTRDFCTTTPRRWALT